MGLSQQEYWSGLPFPFPEDLPNPGIELASLMSPALQADSLHIELSGKPLLVITKPKSSWKQCQDFWVPNLLLQNCHERMGVPKGRYHGMFILLKNFTSFYLFIFWLCSMQDLSSQPELEPVPPAVESTGPTRKSDLFIFEFQVPITTWHMAGAHEISDGRPLNNPMALGLWVTLYREGTWNSQRRRDFPKPHGVASEKPGFDSKSFSLCCWPGGWPRLSRLGGQPYPVLKHLPSCSHLGKGPWVDPYSGPSVTGPYNLKVQHPGRELECQRVRMGECPPIGCGGSQ